MLEVRLRSFLDGGKGDALAKAAAMVGSVPVLEEEPPVVAVRCTSDVISFHPSTVEHVRCFCIDTNKLLGGMSARHAAQAKTAALP